MDEHPLRAESTHGADGRRRPEVEWLRSRLTGETAEQEWARALERGYDCLLDRPIEALLPEASVKKYVEAHLDADLLAALVRPFAGAALEDAVRGMRADELPVQHWVSPSAREIIDRIAARPGIVHEDWIRAIFRERAIEQVLSDTLYRALRDFSTLVPRLVVRVLPVGRIFGAGGVGARVAEEIERLLEPEIKAFIASGSQRALERAAEFMIQHIDDAASIELRRNLVAFALSRAPSFHALALSDRTVADIGVIAEDLARHAAGEPELRDRAHRWIEEGAKRVRGKRLGEVLASIGYDRRPPFAELAAITWPFARTILESELAARWLDRVVRDLADRLG